MYDGEMFFREIPIIHKKVQVPQYQGVAIGAYVICRNGEGYVSILCDNEKKEKALLGYDVINDKISFLSLQQIELLICKIGKEKDVKLHFDKGINFDEIQATVNSNRDIFKNKGLVIINGLKLYYDENAGMFDSFVSMTIAQKSYEIGELVGAVFEDFSCKFLIENSKMNEDFTKISLQNDIKIMIDLGGVEYKEQGVIIKYDHEKNNHFFKLMSYPMYMLGHMIMNNLVFQNIRNPFVVVKYMLESVDIDINGVSVPNESKSVHTFLVVMAINNLKLLNGSCSIGDVRIGEKIKVSGEFEKLIQKENIREYVLIWTDQNATNHYEAYALAKEKLMRIADVVAFLAKNDCMAEYFGIGPICNHWEVSGLFPNMQLMNVAYIEDCIDRQAICVSGNEQIEPHIRELDEMALSNLESDWIEKSYLKCTEENNKKVESLFNAMRWINKVGPSLNKGDKIIYCVMALEFCLYKEKGTTIIEDKLEKYKVVDSSLVELFQKNICVKVKTEGLENIDAQVLEKMEKEINDYTKARLKEASFNSKLRKMIARLHIPITEEEMNLIALFRQKRNSMIHGKGMDEIKDINIKKMIGIVSRIITYKLWNLMEDKD